MDELEYTQKMQKKILRRNFSAPGWALLIYNILFSAVYTAFVMVDIFMEGAAGKPLDIGDWGYFAAIAIGLVLLYLWKKPEFCRDMFRQGRPMKPDRFIMLVTVCLGAQLVSQITVISLELVLNACGYSMMDSLMLLETEDTFSMFLYLALGAPVSEEILFRGMALRSTEHQGKTFAIVTSALLFGLFHANLIQIPFAFLVGLVLGYVAVEYNILWAMVLHMFNNLIYADTTTRLISAYAPQMENALGWAMILLTAVAAGVILLLKYRSIGAYFRKNRPGPLAWKAFFSSPGIIVLIVVLVISTASTVIALAAPLPG